MSDAKGILIIGETNGNSLKGITKELLGVGRHLAEKLGQQVSVLLAGDMGSVDKEAIAYGADEVFIANDPLLLSYQTDCFVAAVCKLCADKSPAIVLIGQTDLGRDLAPRLAARLVTGLCMDCTELDIDQQSGLVLMTRPVYGGNAKATKVCPNAKPQIATVRAKSQECLLRDDAKQGTVVQWDAGITESMVKVRTVSRAKEEAVGVKLEDASVVITGGRGLGGPQGFDLLKELARVWGGAIGGSRAACEEGWLPTAQQVGLTGKIVSPNLYLAVAVSGAMQHLAGCSGARNIVAINRDPEANIFKVARFGLVGDYRQAVPALIEKSKELMAK